VFKADIAWAECIQFQLNFKIDAALERRKRRE